MVKDLEPARCWWFTGVCLILGKRRMRSDVIIIFKYLKVCHRKNGESFFPLPPEEWSQFTKREGKRREEEEEKKKKATPTSRRTS